MAFWDAIGKPKYVCAPMVEASELAFRHLCRYLQGYLTHKKTASS